MAVTQTRHVGRGVISTGSWTQVAGDGIDSMPDSAGYSVEAKFQNQGIAADVFIAFMPSGTAPVSDTADGVFKFPSTEFATDGLKSWFETMDAGECVFLKCASDTAWRTVAITEPYEAA